MEPVTIVDRNVLKVLSVDTRVDILKELSEGDRTPAYLSKRLKKSDATIVEHLDILCKAGLVKKIEHPGKKWIFYTLTERGEGIVSSKSRRLVIVLGISILSGAAGLTGFITHTLSNGRFASAETLQKAGETAQIVTAPVEQAATPWLLYLSILLMALSVMGATFYLSQKIKYKGELSV